jgi:zona occludens toxin (predicted ATPase)
MIVGYVGTPGSGKSYEAVKEILGRIKTGRKVYTNVDGLQQPECREAIKSYCNITTEQLDICLNYLTDEEAKEFWRHIDTGSVAVIDECHKLFSNREWNTEKNLDFCNWMSTHRHEGCDVILVTQDIEKIDKHARSLIEWTYFFRKMNQFGKGLETRYLCYSYQGDNHKGQPLKKNVRKYDKDIFRCYKSYVADDIKELGLAQKVNMLRHPIIYAIPVMFLFFGYLFSQSTYSEGKLIRTPEVAIVPEKTKIVTQEGKERQNVVNADKAVFQKLQEQKSEDNPKPWIDPEGKKDLVVQWQMPDGSIVYTNNGFHPMYATFVGVVN